MTDLKCPHCGHGLTLVPSSTPQVTPGVAPEVDLKALLVVYQAEQEVTEQWSPAWASTAKGHLGKFLGSGYSLDRPGVADWRAELVEAGLAPGTVNLHLTSLRAFAQWLVARGSLSSNPVDGQKLKGNTKGAQEERLAFTPAEVRALLDYVLEQEPVEGFAGMVQTMAYTGARNEEVAQLRIEDRYRHESGVVVLDFATMADGRRRKTAASRRLVPVHSKLAAWFLEWQTEGLDPQTNLWGFKPVSGRYGYACARWVNQTALPALKQEGKIRADKRLTLYSLRHSVVTQLKHQGVAEDLIAELVGHTNTSMTTGRYGKRYPVEKLVEVVESIEW